MRIKRKAILLLVILLLSGGFAGFGRENSTELYRKGARLAVRGEIDEAIGVFKKVVEMSPNYCLGHYGLGKAYLYKYGMLEDAIKHLSISVSLDKKYSKGHFYLGMGYLLSRNYRQAVRSYKNAYAIDDTLTVALYNIAVCYETIGSHHEATIYYAMYKAQVEMGKEDIVF
jgi:tetratricopeptide (TPR) repeat protein